MNYTNHHAVFTNKFKGYSAEQCAYALQDCHATLEALGSEAGADYIVKVWAEIDALRERQLQLSRRSHVKGH